ncbi:MAG: CDP-glycerol glycerophosphotransferase family protein [Clostridiaceae bacterium]|nr:CDP-glycerol glycerophosphotransferase family protein [Clostridiaceae bacterium]
MSKKIKDFLQSTFLYTIYLFFVRHFRKFKSWLIKATNPLYRFYTFRLLYPSAYRRAARKPVDENKVVFIELRLPSLTNSFKLMYDTLYINYDFDIHCHFLRNTYVNRKTYRKNCVKMLKDIATAKYVFFDEATNVTSHVKFRPETVITQLWHGCGAFKKFGYSTADAIFGASRKDMDKYPFNRGYTNVTVSSPEVIWAYEEAMNYSHESGVVKALGSSRTDIFYNKDFIAKAYETLYSVMPQAKGKKVILYAPTFRGRVAKARTPNVLSPEFMKYVLGNDYVLLMKHHPLVRKRPKIPEVCADFARDVTDEMTIEDLLCVSDICISDYSSLVFEYSLFERPMIFLAHDLDEFFDWRGFYYDYFELTPGPVFKSTTEVIEYIQNIDKLFDKERVRAFRKKFMSSCDGHATERIMDVMFGKALESHKRAEPLPEKPYHLIPHSDDFVVEEQNEDSDDDESENKDGDESTKSDSGKKSESEE